MPNVATILKQEIVRLARKEARRETEALRRGATQHRKTLAALNRRIGEVRRELAILSSRTKRAVAVPAPEAEGSPVRFSSKGLKSHRERLGLSAEGLASLVGVSSQTIYNWEHAVVRPGRRHLERLVQVRAMGKREAMRELEALSPAGAKAAAPAAAEAPPARTKAKKKV